MIFSEAYIDESGTHDGSPILTVAGYLFERTQARRFERDWGKVLDKYGLPYAHMKEAVCCKGVYKDAGMTIGDCENSNRLLIQNIKKRTRFGFGVSVDPAMYSRIVGHYNNAPSAYSFALQGCFTIIRRWVERTGYNGSIAYVFEAGHASQGEANRYIADALLGSNSAKAKHRYASHNFICKRLAKPLHAADMLAWHYHHFIARRIERGIEKPRADFAALVRDKDVSIAHDEESLIRFRKQIVDEGWLVGRY